MTVFEDWCQEKWTNLSEWNLYGKSSALGYLKMSYLIIYTQVTWKSGFWLPLKVFVGMNSGLVNECRERYVVRELNLNGPSRVTTSVSLPVCLSLSPHLAIFLSIAPHPILFYFFQSLSLCFPVYRSQGASLVAQGKESTCNTGSERDPG